MRLLLLNILISSFWVNLVAGYGEMKCLTSPGYPHKYPNNNEVNQSLSVPDGNIVITLEDIDVNYWLYNDSPACWEDYLQFYDGNGKEVGEKLCVEDHFEHKQLIIPTSTATLLFHSSENKYSNNSQRGFKLCYKASTTCLTSPDYPNNYPHNSDTTQFMSVPEGHTLQITFEEFDIDDGGGDSCGSDYLEFTDGRGNKFGEKMCGDSYPRTFNLPTFNIPTSNASVLFHSNGSARKKGFKLCYEPSKDCEMTQPPIGPGGGVSRGPYWDEETNMITKDFSCNNGFSMVGESVFHCISGVWSSDSHICISNKNCSLSLPILRNGIATGSGKHYSYTMDRPFDHGDKYVGSFSCDPGFTLVGEKDVDCVGGVWSSEFPVCTSASSSGSLTTSSSGKTFLKSHRQYPSYYDEWSDTIHFLSVPTGQAIQVTFLDFDVGWRQIGDCEHDYVQFTDGNGNTIGEKLCGTSLDEAHTTFDIPTSTASVRFHSDHWPYHNRKGFKLFYQGIQTE